MTKKKKSVKRGKGYAYRLPSEFVCFTWCVGEILLLILRYYLPFKYINIYYLLLNIYLDVFSYLNIGTYICTMLNYIKR